MSEAPCWRCGGRGRLYALKHEFNKDEPKHIRKGDMLVPNVDPGTGHDCNICRGTGIDSKAKTSAAGSDGE